MFTTLSYKEVQELKKKYPAGTQLVLDKMRNDPRPIEAGTKGTVNYVDDIGTLHCDFAGGRRLGLVPGMDEFHIDAPQSTIKPEWRKTCLCLASDEFDDLINEIYPGKQVRAHYDMDGLWYSSDADEEWEKFDDEIADDIGKYLGIEVTSIHIDDAEYTGVWIVYKPITTPAKGTKETTREEDVF